MGVGLLNAKAISVSAEMRAGTDSDLGLRGSAEVVGTALLTLGIEPVASLWLEISFLVYASGVDSALVLFVAQEENIMRLIKKAKA